jgi:hypothetical protein
MASIPTFLPLPRGVLGGEGGGAAASFLLRLKEPEEDRTIVEAMAPATAPTAMAWLVISLSVDL